MPETPDTVDETTDPIEETEDSSQDLTKTVAQAAVIFMAAFGTYKAFGWAKRRIAERYIADHPELLETESETPTEE